MKMKTCIYTVQDAYTSLRHKWLHLLFLLRVCLQCDHNCLHMYLSPPLAPVH